MGYKIHVLDRKYSKWELYNATTLDLEKEDIDPVKNKLFNGSTLDNNSKILVLREQGVGDEILYGSMYGNLLKKNKNVTFECDERLIPLFQYSFNQNYKDKGKKLLLINLWKRFAFSFQTKK